MRWLSLGSRVVLISGLGGLFTLVNMMGGGVLGRSGGRSSYGWREAVLGWAAAVEWAYMVVGVSKGMWWACKVLNF